MDGRVNNGPISLWMNLVMTNQSTSTQALLTLQNKLRQMQLASFPGENVLTCTNQISSICHQLQAAGQLPNDIAYVICIILSKCSVQSFQYAFMGKGSELTLNRNKYTYTEILSHATCYYQSLVDCGEWLKTRKTDEQFQGLVTRIAKLELSKKTDQNGNKCIAITHKVL
ncbi:MAG: hypothetical protein ACREOZ_01190 [Gloeomargaritales cyanobacterium]